MLIIKQGLSKKEKLAIQFLLSEIPDVYSEFYLTRNRLRIFIKENLALLFENLKKGDKIIYEKDRGIAIITGFAEKTIEIFDTKTNETKIVPSRKHIKILAKDAVSVERILKFAGWHFKEDLFCKMKRANPSLQIFLNNGYQFAGGRGKEILLRKPPKLKREFIPQKD